MAHAVPLSAPLTYDSAIRKKHAAATAATGVITVRSIRLRDSTFIAVFSVKYPAKIQTRTRATAASAPGATSPARASPIHAA